MKCIYLNEFNLRRLHAAVVSMGVIVMVCSGIGILSEGHPSPS